jgi:hypothetical protein
MAMNNLVGVSKRHAENTKSTRLDMFYFWWQWGQWEAPRGSMLRAVDALLKDIKGTKKCIRAIKSTRVKNILYFYIFLNEGLSGNMIGRKTLEAPPPFF